MGSLVSSEILSSNRKPLILLFLGEFVRDPTSKLLSETHRLKVAWNCRKITIHLFAQFSACLAAIFLQKMPELVLVHLGWSSGASLRSKLSCLNLANQSRAVLSAIASFPYTAQISLVASLAFWPRLKAKRRRCRKCDFLSTWQSIWRL